MNTQKIELNNANWAAVNDMYSDLETVIENNYHPEHLELYIASRAEFDALIGKALKKHLAFVAKQAA